MIEPNEYPMFQENYQPVSPVDPPLVTLGAVTESAVQPGDTIVLEVAEAPRITPPTISPIGGVAPVNLPLQHSGDTIKHVVSENIEQVTANWKMEFSLFNPRREIGKGEISVEFLNPIAGEDTAQAGEIISAEEITPLDVAELAPQPAISESLVTPPEPDSLSTKPVLQSEWFVSLIILQVVIVGVVKRFRGKYLADLMKSTIFPSYVNRLNTTNASNVLPSIMLGVLFYFNFSLFLFQAMNHFGINIPGVANPLQIALIFASLFIFFQAKVITYKLVAIIFGTKRETNGFLAEASALSQVYGVILLPVVILIPFVDESIQVALFTIGIGIYAGLYLLQLSRGIANNFSSLLSGYYLILYFCALEIIPLTLLFKILFR